MEKSFTYIQHFLVIEQGIKIKW